MENPRFLHPLVLAAVLAAAIVPGGCGQSGDLYMPPPVPAEDPDGKGRESSG